MPETVLTREEERRVIAEQREYLLKVLPGYLDHVLPDLAISEREYERLSILLAPPIGPECAPEFMLYPSVIGADDRADGCEAVGWQLMTMGKWEYLPWGEERGERMTIEDGMIEHILVEIVKERINLYTEWLRERRKGNDALLPEAPAAPK